MREDPEFVETGLDDPSLAAVTRGFARRLQRLHRRDLADNGVISLLDWGRTWLPEHFRVQPSVMHHWMAEQLQAAEHNRAARTNVIGPRGHAKSTVATLAYPLRAAVEGTEPYIWIVSETAEQAALHLENIKTELIGNARLRQEYPEAAARGAIWRGELIVLPNGVAIEALGSGQQVRGRRWRQHRPTLIICDDLEGDRHVVSQRARAATQRWFHTALMKAGGPRTNVIHLGTALHREALGMQLCRTPGWNARLFPAMGRMPERMDLWEQWERLLTDWECAEREVHAEAYWQQHRTEMEAGCELLWPEVDDLPRLMRLRAEGGIAAFEREKQCSPRSPEACEWPQSYFTEPLWFADWPSNLRAKVMALDPSKGTEDRRGDYSAYVVLGMGEDGVLYVESDLARRPTPQMVADGVELTRRHRPQVFAVEANQYQQLLCAEFRRELIASGAVISEAYPVMNQVSKLVRIRRLGPYLAAGRFRFKSNSAGTELLVRQLQDFPVADHDDGPDALEMALRITEELLAPVREADGLGARLSLSGY